MPPRSPNSFSARTATLESSSDTLASSPKTRPDRSRTNTFDPWTARDRNPAAPRPAPGLRSQIPVELVEGIHVGDDVDRVGRRAQDDPLHHVVRQPLAPNFWAGLAQHDLRHQGRGRSSFPRGHRPGHKQRVLAGIVPHLDDVHVVTPKAPHPLKRPDAGPLLHARRMSTPPPNRSPASL